MWPEFRLEMVRCGIAMYGHWPSISVRDRMSEITPTFSLVPALRFYAPIVHAMEVASGDSVGYGCEFRAARDSRIAVLPVGYADGVPRAAGQGRFEVRLRHDRYHR
jgi:alanine racemase